MKISPTASWFILFLQVSLITSALQGVQGESDTEGPSESECMPYVEKALKKLETGAESNSVEDTEGSKEDLPTMEITTDDSIDQPDDGENDTHTSGIDDSVESIEHDQNQNDLEKSNEQEDQKSTEDDNDNKNEDSVEKEQEEESKEAENADNAESIEEEAKEDSIEGTEAANASDDKDSKEDNKTDDSNETDGTETDTKTEEDTDSKETKEEASKEDETDKADGESQEGDSKQESKEETEDKGKESAEEAVAEDNTEEEKSTEDEAKSTEDEAKSAEEGDREKRSVEGDSKEDEDSKEKEEEKSKEENTKEGDSKEGGSKEEEEKSKDDVDSKEKESSKEEADSGTASTEDGASVEEGASEEDNTEGAPVEDLTMDIEIPSDLKSRDHVEAILKLDEDSSEKEEIINRVAEITLRQLKKLYENAIKPLEVLYKYRDLSNRHFGDAEIFSKPLILFMGPWSGGKSSIVNYLTNNEYNETSLRTGAEPSPAYFNILMHGEEPEVLDGTQLAADFTFSGLQKFGQGLEERLRGLKLPSKLLEKVNIVEIPGILEVRKQVSRAFPFNDACQWFIDRADIIFLIYDPSKLDVGIETEAILDQLKGREHQTRIILNKADQVKPEELMRVQGALIWNISPLMSSPQPPIMYTTSLWSRPYETWAPVRLLRAQERAFLRDLRGAIDKRIENKIASARRFAVRVRNHAKMVDCYLTTYYNHKSVFGNHKQVAESIIQQPQDYHIYEGLSTLTNISRYDLPDPEVYKDFFKLNNLYDFQQLSATCTYFRGCPINKLDVAIAYDLPEMVGNYRRNVELALQEANISTAGT